MTETNFTSRLLRGLRRELPGAWIQKFNSFGGMVAGGIPDFCVATTERTRWFEVKLAGRKMFAGKNAKLQWETLRRIGGRYVVWNVALKSGYVFAPREWGSHETCSENTFVNTFDGLVAEIVAIAIAQREP